MGMNRVKSGLDKSANLALGLRLVHCHPKREGHEARCKGPFLFQGIFPRLAPSQRPQWRVLMVQGCSQINGIFYTDNAVASEVSSLEFASSSYHLHGWEKCGTALSGAINSELDWTSLG